MQFFRNDMRVYIDPKDERKTYQKILKDENYHPIPSKLIYSPIIKQEIEDLLKDKITVELPSLYPNTHLYWLKGDVLFFQGLPGAAFTGIFMEELIALGVTEIIFLGLAGGIQSAIIGDKFIVTEALRYEGTSYHYLPGSLPAIPSENLMNNLFSSLKEKMKCKKGKICSTDAPFRETFELITELRHKEVIGIEMEISAVYAISQFRKINAVALVVISDELKDEGWSQFQPKIYLKEFIMCLELLIELFSRF
ncbi:MAG: phosphorylase family protein [Candidatus Hodarchaeales archaeon]|jgi:purine-nucleoside phosphorylase